MDEVPVKELPECGWLQENVLRRTSCDVAHQHILRNSIERGVLGELRKDVLVASFIEDFDEDFKALLGSLFIAKENVHHIREGESFAIIVLGDPPLVPFKSLFRGTVALDLPPLTVRAALRDVDTGEVRQGCRIHQ